MAPLTPEHEKILTAFVTALAQQDEPLPTPLQKQLHAIGLNLENRAMELPVIAASVSDLHKAYQDALADAQADSGGQGATLVSSTPDEYSTKLERAAEIFTDPNPVQAAQRSMPKFSGQFASNPLKRLFRRS